MKDLVVPKEAELLEPVGRDNVYTSYLNFAKEIDIDTQRLTQAQEQYCPVDDKIYNPVNYTECFRELTKAIYTTYGYSLNQSLRNEPLPADIRDATIAHYASIFSKIWAIIESKKLQITMQLAEDFIKLFRDIRRGYNAKMKRFRRQMMTDAVAGKPVHIDDSQTSLIYINYLEELLQSRDLDLQPVEEIFYREDLSGNEVSTREYLVNQTKNQLFDDMFDKIPYHDDDFLQAMEEDLRKMKSSMKRFDDKMSLKALHLFGERYQTIRMTMEQQFEMYTAVATITTDLNQESVDDTALINALTTLYAKIKQENPWAVFGQQAITTVSSTSTDKYTNASEYAIAEVFSVFNIDELTRHDYQNERFTKIRARLQMSSYVTVNAHIVLKRIVRALGLVYEVFKFTMAILYPNEWGYLGTNNTLEGHLVN